MNAVSPERNSTGMDKIMETLDSIGIKLLLLAARKKTFVVSTYRIFFCLRCAVPVSVH